MKKIKKRRVSNVKKICIITAALSLLGGAGGSRAYAAEQEVQFEKTYNTTDKEDKADGLFENTYEKDGILYGLTDVKTELLQTIVTEGETYYFQSEVFTDAAENHLPAEQVEKEDGLYILSESELLRGTAKEREKYAEANITYHLEYVDDMPQVGQVSVKDDDTGLEVNQRLPLLRTNRVSTYWKDDFRFPITISDYDADSFMLGGVRVSAEDELIDYADEFLSYLDLPKEYYHILDIEWSGAPYEQDGTVMRDAEATGERLITDIVATYGGNISLPSIEGQYYRCTYIKDGTETGTVYQMKATATYTMEEEVVQVKSIWERILEWILQHPLESACVAMILIFLMIAIILFILGKKKKEEEEEQQLKRLQ